MALISEITSLLIFTSEKERRFAISLLFTPFGIIASWKLSRLNRKHQDFPVGTYVANMLAIALNGSLGAFLSNTTVATSTAATSPKIVLQSIVDGFGGSLSTLTRFLIEVLNGIDPIIGRTAGLQYLGATLVSGLIIGFVTKQATDWADTEHL
mmetsp:Transcript_7347/g.15891  ORF Transcript_7347/g.15891 Transcript_7347/m.15891 type:complete len:153 (-) Transcript_7347:51-509(-)